MRLEPPERSRKVSVVVPTRNSERTLQACLESVRSQSYPEMELIVVDNGSTDSTSQIARGLADVVVTAGPERSAQRNRGAAEATGFFVLMVDSDMVLAAPVIEQCVEASTTERLDAVVIPERSVGSGFWAACKALERSCYVGDETVEAARFFTKDAFDRHGGYDEEMTSGEDWDLPARMRADGARIGRVDAEIVHLEGNLKLRDTMAKKFYYGRQFGPYLRRHPELARRQLVPLRRAFIRHRRRLAQTPALTAGMLAMKAGEFAAGGAGFARAWLRNVTSTRES